MSKLRDSKSYSINDLLGWYYNDELIISPKYQRNSVWNGSAKSYLIDTILRGYPIPPIFIRQKIDVINRKTSREIIDGQQRIRTILQFLKGEIKVMKSHNEQFQNLKFEDLDVLVKEEFLGYNLSFEIINTSEDALIYEMFARLNTNNVPLNKQEIRNATYWGEFKVFVYRKTYAYTTWLMEKSVFTDKEFVRMADVEFFNSLTIHLIDGILDETPTKIEQYYKQFDTKFDTKDLIEAKLDFIFKIIDLIFDESFSTELFNKKNYLFTLFCALNHLIFGIPNFDFPRNPRFNHENIEDNILSIVETLSDLEVLVSQNPDSEFEKLHKQHTTSKNERTQRIRYLLELL